MLLGLSSVLGKITLLLSNKILPLLVGLRKNGLEMFRLNCCDPKFFHSPVKKNKAIKIVPKTAKWEKHGQNFIIKSQTTGLTLRHTSAYHLSTLAFLEKTNLSQMLSAPT